MRSGSHVLYVFLQAATRTCSITSHEHFVCGKLCCKSVAPQVFCNDHVQIHVRLPPGSPVHGIYWCMCLWAG